MDTEFEDAPTTPVEAPRKSVAQWAQDKGHVSVRKGMRKFDMPVKRALPHAYGAASLVNSKRGVELKGFTSTAEYHAALMGTVVTEAEYDAAVKDFQSIVLR